MSSTTTTRLALVKATPGTSEPVNVATQINANWDKIDSVIGATLCTSSTRPTAPYSGQLIRETDTGKVYLHNGSTPASAGWGQIAAVAVAFDDILTGQRTAAADIVYGGRVTGDANRRFEVRADGRVNWGPGSAGTDTNLYRNAANELKTDDDFAVGGDLAVSGGLAADGFASTSFSPNVYTGGGSSTISRTVIDARYWRLGDLIIAQATATLGASTSSGCAIDLPVASAVRSLNCGTCALFGSSVPSTQTCIATMTSSMDKLVITAFNGGFLDGSSGQTIRYSVMYPAA